MAYLAREVPLWSGQNHCFSCHNNGDGARALYAAVRHGLAVPPQALAATTAWLRRPAEWDSNHGDPGFSDKKLARIQFAAALTAAYDTGLIKDRAALLSAAESLLPYQEKDGAWRVDGEASLGSPTTWGAPLATALARRALEAAGEVRLSPAIRQAERWLAAAPARSTLDAAAVYMAIRKRECAELLLRSQTAEGGWGPYPNTPAEVFDTAIAMLALSREAPAALARARAYLERTQLPEGGWPETTRPAGSRSYAQHISTTAWATLALLETAPPAL